jgi:Tfp pilus assembly PilM family ATPase
MSPSWLPRAVISPVGLDIGGAEVRAVQLRRAPGGAETMVASAVFPLPGEPGPARPLTVTDAAWIAGVLARRGFVGNRVSVFAPHGTCSAQIVELPDRGSGAPVAMIARAEVARSRRCAPDRFELATWYLPQRGRGERGMAVACERTDLDTFLDALEEGGLTPVGVDLEETALARSCAGVLGAEPESIHAMLRIGWNATLGVLTLGDTVVYTRRFEFGVGSAIARLRNATGLSWNDAQRVLESAAPDAPEPDAFERPARALWATLGEQLGREIDTAVTYVSHAYRTAAIGRVLIAGYGAHRPEMVERLDEALGMPVMPAPALGATPGTVGAARLAIAAGLAGRFDQ